MDAIGVASSLSQSPSHFRPIPYLQFLLINEEYNLLSRCCSQQRHFYLAVDGLHFKMETLVDLLAVAGRRSGLPIVVCCRSRDELDAVCSAVSNLPYISLASLNQNVTAQSGDDSEIGKDVDKSHMIVVTDACLALFASGESPISARVLINDELPIKKETYSRRMASYGIVINMVVGGEVVTLKSVEESSSLVITEMPINISEIL
ncbi:hypothetical protein P3X46_018796 [Hevea brasiliensis]|uniref:Helicase C-terminal domain-containing protein n=1 Tax=Hevea brasiliensis TaxID=3981 RepID=A0ABQ9LVT4_HEVBR|nr:hypothetical protein P3X46_018796 [Hevea brasiliensis]